MVAATVQKKCPKTYHVCAGITLHLGSWPLSKSSHCGQARMWERPTQGCGCIVFCFFLETMLLTKFKGFEIRNLEGTVKIISILLITKLMKIKKIIDQV